MKILRHLSRAVTAIGVSALATMSISVNATAQAACGNGGQLYGNCIEGPTLTEYGAAAAYNGYANGPAFFGNATNAAQPAAAGGTWQAFERNGFILNHPTRTGGHANQVAGAIHARWGQDQFEYGKIGYPQTRESQGGRSGVSGVSGRYNFFENGSIFWSPASGAHWVSPDVRNKWQQSNNENGPYGYPIAEQSDCMDTSYRMGPAHAQQFEGGFISTDNRLNPRFSTTLGGPFQSSVFPVNGIPTLKLLVTPVSQDLVASVDTAINQWNAVSKKVRLQRVLADGPGVVKIHSVPIPLLTPTGGISLGGYSPTPSVDNANIAIFTGSVVLMSNNITSGSATNSDNYGRLLQQVITHEVGHALGLAHNCAGQMMQPTVNMQTLTTIGPLDIATLNEIWK